MALWRPQNKTQTKPYNHEHREPNPQYLTPTDRFLHRHQNARYDQNTQSPSASPYLAEAYKMSTPSSIRISDEGLKALKILEATTKKKRVDIISAALIEKANHTAAQPAVHCRLLAPSEILTLQSEIAALEMLHQDNRRTLKIRTEDKDATSKIIRAVEKIDAETEQLMSMRSALANLATAAEIASSATSDTDAATKITNLVAKIEAEAEQLRVKIAAENEQLRAKLAAQTSAQPQTNQLSSSVAEIVATAKAQSQAEIKQLIDWAIFRLKNAKPETYASYELELKLLDALFL